MLMDNTEKFTGKADGYEKFRPSYPKELYAFMTRMFGADESIRIADIGAGTGKFARPLIEAGMNVTCVEPNRDMLGVLSSRFGMYPNFSTRYSMFLQLSFASCTSPAASRPLFVK